MCIYVYVYVYVCVYMYVYVYMCMYMCPADQAATVPRAKGLRHSGVAPHRTRVVALPLVEKAPDDNG